MDPVTSALDAALRRLDSAKASGKAGARSYAASGDVVSRARAFDQETSDQERRALERLDRLLRSGQQMRGDVPRGFYFDLAV